MKILRNMISGLLISILIGTLVMISVYALPVDRIRNNVRSSLDLIFRTGDRIGGIAGDITLLNAVHKKSDSVINDAMMNPRMNYYKLQYENLQTSLDDSSSETGEIIYYSRYWHGYLAYLKPLLMLMTFEKFVMLSFFLQFVLFIAVFIKIYEKLGKLYSFAFALIIFMLKPIILALCHELAVIYYITLITILIMLSKNDKLNLNGKYYYLFMFDGISVAFFDFLTYPFVALGLPTIFYLLLNENKSLRQKFSNIIKFAFSWSWGYIGMWTGKWCAASLLTDYNTINDALKNLLWRLNGDYSEIIPVPPPNTWFAPTIRNLQFHKMMLIFASMLILLSVLYLVLVKKYEWNFELKIVLPLFFTFFYPFAWYIIVNNHSFVHSWVTHKLLIISVFALCCVLIKSLRPSKYCN